MGSIVSILNKEEIAKNLSKMIKINTVRSEDLSNIYEFQSLLEELYPTIYEKGEKILIDNSLLIKINGKNKNINPILIMSHTDVVEAEGNWTYPPFSGEIANGCVWGRGTVDTKGSLCAFFEATESLLKEGFIPEGDLYLASSIDEERLNI